MLTTQTQIQNTFLSKNNRIPPVPTQVQPNIQSNHFKMQMGAWPSFSLNPFSAFPLPLSKFQIHLHWSQGSACPESCLPSFLDPSHSSAGLQPHWLSFCSLSLPSSRPSPPAPLTPEYSVPRLYRSLWEEVSASVPSFTPHSPLHDSLLFHWFHHHLKSSRLFIWSVSLVSSQ